MSQKNILLVIVVVLIIMGIIFIQQTKKIEYVLLDQEELNELSVDDQSERIKLKSEIYPKAKELVQPNGYLNTDQITIAEHLGKDIILVDFWTYSCINCQRTIPYLNTWHEKYKDKGLLIIGVHTPEFEFEKDYHNVRRAMEKLEIKYPVVQDNNYQTWLNYKNRYWPHKYLIDIDGYVPYDHIGEGAYEETEQKIQELLEERNRILNLKTVIKKTISSPSTPNPEFRKIGTPEIYFGYEFSHNQIGNKEGWQQDETVIYKKPEMITKNLFYLDGSWKNNKDNMELVGSTGAITLDFFAKEVYFVAGAPQPTEIIVYLDGEEVKTLTVTDFDLYTVVSLPDYRAHTLELKSDSGLMAYTFTFG